MQLTYNHNLQIVNIHFSLSLLYSWLHIDNHGFTEAQIVVLFMRWSRASKHQQPQSTVVDCIVRVDDCCVFRDPTGVGHGSILMYRVRGCCRQVGGWWSRVGGRCTSIGILVVVVPVAIGHCFECILDALWAVIDLALWDLDCSRRRKAISDAIISVTFEVACCCLDFWRLRQNVMVAFDGENKRRGRELTSSAEVKWFLLHHQKCYFYIGIRGSFHTTE